MTIEQALEEADFISEGCGVSERTARATMTLANEVRRLRAGVEAVRALPRVELEPSGGSLIPMLHGIPLTASIDFHAVDLADVLAALDDPVEPEVGGDG